MQIHSVGPSIARTQAAVQGFFNPGRLRLVADEYRGSKASVLNEWDCAVTWHTEAGRLHWGS